MPPVTLNILIINALLWLATIVFNKAGIFDLQAIMGMHYWRASDFNAAQLLTHMFLHKSGGIAHLFCNMFSLFMFGTTLERVLGGKRFLFYYLTCGLGAALVQQLAWEFTWEDELVKALAALNHSSYDEIRAFLNSGSAEAMESISSFWNYHIVIGASGAVFGILLAFGMLFPNMPLYIIPIPFPIKAKYMVIGYGLIEFFFGVTGTMSRVGHFAHLGGMLFGFLILMYWRYGKGSRGRYGDY